MTNNKPLNDTEKLHLIAEFKLIQEKKSTLSRKIRDKIERIIADLISKGQISKELTLYERV